MDLERQQYHYYAFISYSSADGQWAKWIQNKLESYRLPTALRKENIDIPKRINPVFRDTTDLSTGVLKDVLRQELQASKFLIVLCSPSSAKSAWVNEEVKAFIEMGREASIIPLVVEGEPFAGDPAREAFPPALREMEQELIGISVEKFGRKEAFLRVVAALLEIRYDKLADRDRRRTRSRKLIAGIAALIAAVGIGCGLWYNAPHSKYYSAYGYADEIPYGINQLSDRQREGLSYSYEITTRRGKVIQLRRVNMMDELAVAPFTFPTSEDARIDFSYDAAGRLIQVKNYNEKNIPVSTESLTYDHSNHRIAIDYHANEDSIEAFAMLSDLTYGAEGDENSEITRQINTYDDRGYLIKAEYMRDNLGNRASDSNGVYGKQYEYDDRGLVTRISNLDYNGQLYNCKYGWATIELEYDDAGRIIAEQNYDAQGNPARNGTAAVRVEYVYNETGNLSESRVLDEQGNIANDKLGIAQRAFLYDENGMMLVVMYGGANGKFTGDEDGVCAKQFVYDDFGRKCGIINLDEDLNPTDSPVTGYSAEYYTLDEMGRVVKGMYFDKNFNRVCEPTLGSHAYEYVYNEDSVIIACRYFDTDLNLAVNSQGYASWELDVDDSGNMNRITFKDAQGNLSDCSVADCAVGEFEYDAFGNPKIQRFYDANNQLTEIWEVRYENGRLVQMKFYDGNYAPSLYELGCFEGRRGYDEKGNLIWQAYYDVDGNLMDGVDGIAMFRYEYDEYGNEVLLEIFDKDMKPAYLDGFCKIKYTYDNRNNVVRQEKVGHTPASSVVTIATYSENDRLLETTVYDGNGKLLKTD